MFFYLLRKIFKKCIKILRFEDDLDTFITMIFYICKIRTDNSERYFLMVWTGEIVHIMFFFIILGLLKSPRCVWFVDMGHVYQSRWGGVNAHYIAVQGQKAVNAYFSSKQLPPFVFAVQYRSSRRDSLVTSGISRLVRTRDYSSQSLSVAPSQPVNQSVSQTSHSTSTRNLTVLVLIRSVTDRRRESRTNG